MRDETHSCVLDPHVYLVGSAHIFMDVADYLAMREMRRYHIQKKRFERKNRGSFMSASLIFCTCCGAANRDSASHCFACEHALCSEGEPIRDTPITMFLHAERYHILSILGQGGYSTVYKAANTQQNGQLVAIKSVNLCGLSAGEIIDATETFNREWTLLSELSHPNLPRLHEYFSDPEHWYLVMDFIDGQTLEHYLRVCGSHLPLTEVLTIGIHICSILDYLHTRQPPVIFRDVKPANIMRSQSGQFFLIDFGIARRFRPGGRRDTTLLGSSGYAAPEQYGQFQTSPRTDIYGLGMTLWQLLSGQDPATTLITQKTVSLPSQNFSLSHGLKCLLAQMLHPDAQQRPASIRAVRERLQTLDIQESQEYKPLLAGKQSSTSPIIIPFQAGTSTNTIASTSPGSGQITQQQYNPSSAKQVPAPQKPKMTRRKVLIGITGVLGTMSGIVWFHRTATTPTLMTYTGHQSSVHATAWAPHSTHIASGDQQGTVHIWDALSGSTLQIFQDEQPVGGPINTISWSPNSNALVAGYKNAMKLWHLDQKTPMFAWSQMHSYVAWSPDGKYIAALGQDHSNMPAIVIFDAFHGTIIAPPLSIQAPLKALAWSPMSSQIAASYGASTLPIQIWDISGASTSVQSIGLNNFANLQDIRSLTWSPDGLSIAAGDMYGLVETFYVADGSLNDQFSVQQPVYSLAWSPSHSWGTSAADASGIITISVFGDGRKTITTGNQPLFSFSWSPDGKSLVASGAATTVGIWQTPT
jgi:eukaryotic-like serine/threonine-protein kinase